MTDADLASRADLLALVAEIPIIVLQAARANPAGFLAVAQALASGEVKHPGRGLGPSPDQSVTDHLGGCYRHAWRATTAPTLLVDIETKLPHAGLAAARGILAVQRAADLAEGGDRG